MNKDTLPPIDLESVVKFLLGEGPLNEHHFGEKPDGHGPYWWRTYLRQVIESDRAQRVPDGMVLVERWILDEAETALGHFCSDLGWSDADMQAMDNLSAVLAASPPTGEPTPEPQGVPEPDRQAFENRMLAFGWRNFEGSVRGDPPCWYYDNAELTYRWIGWREAMRTAHPQPPAEPAPSAQPAPTQAAVDGICALIADDALCASFQSIGQYRTALLWEIKRRAALSPSQPQQERKPLSESEVTGLVYASPIYQAAVSALNGVKAWRDCDGNDGFPHEVREQIEAVLMAYESRLRGITSAPKAPSTPTGEV